MMFNGAEMAMNLLIAKLKLLKYRVSSSKHCGSLAASTHDGSVSPPPARPAYSRQRSITLPFRPPIRLADDRSTDPLQTRDGRGNWNGRICMCGRPLRARVSSKYAKTSLVTKYWKYSHNKPHACWQLLRISQFMRSRADEKAALTRTGLDTL